MRRLGHLYSTTGNMVDYHLTPVNRHVLLLRLGMYGDEHPVFRAILPQRCLPSPTEDPQRTERQQALPSPASADKRA